MLEITTGSLRNRKKVLIDGHEYNVRKLGAGEELAISQMVRELNRLQKKSEAKTLTEADEDRGMEIAEKIFDMMVATYDDGGDGSKSRELVESLSNEELAELNKRIFNGESTPDPATKEQPAPGK